MLTRTPAAAVVTVRVRRVGVCGRRGRVAAAALPVLAIGLVCRQPLDNAIAGQHATIDAEVPAHHEGTHGRVLACQLIRFVRQVGLVLAPVDQDQARVATGFPVTLVCGLFPPTPLAEACRSLR